MSDPLLESIKNKIAEKICKHSQNPLMCLLCTIDSLQSQLKESQDRVKVLEDRIKELEDLYEDKGWYDLSRK